MVVLPSKDRPRRLPGRRGFFIALQFLPARPVGGTLLLMLTPEALAWLRCPLDPKREAALVNEETHLACSRCRVRFRIRDGFPNLVPDEAELPDGCTSVKQLPCRKS